MPKIFKPALLRRIRLYGSMISVVLVGLTLVGMYAALVTLCGGVAGPLGALIGLAVGFPALTSAWELFLDRMEPYWLGDE